MNGGSYIARFPMGNPGSIAALLLVHIPSRKLSSFVYSTHVQAVLLSIGVERGTIDNLGITMG